jgi:hypothetical protein
MARSLRLSNEEVASSSMRIAGPFKNVRAMESLDPGIDIGSRIVDGGKFLDKSAAVAGRIENHHRERGLHSR